MPENTTPGVYTEEIPQLPPSIAAVETAIPAFIGYTEKADGKQPGDLLKKPFRINALPEYEQYFGKPAPESESLTAAFTVNGNQVLVTGKVDETKRSKFLMHYALQLFFANGGGPCFIVSVGNYLSSGGIIEATALQEGLAAAANEAGITILLFPDAMNIDTADDYYNLHKSAIDQCAQLQDRFTLLDVFHAPENGDDWKNDVEVLRAMLNDNSGGLKYAAAYFPRIFTPINFSYAVNEVEDESLVKIEGGPAGASTLADLKQISNAKYFQAKSAIDNIPMLLPATVAMAGIYAMVDNARGVWKAPANVAISNAISPLYTISSSEQQDLNIDVNAGKSINAIRTFTGKGLLVWGARTLDGNSNEWRYISVRRFCTMVEVSIKLASQQFVFEPNNQNTWLRVQSMITNFLTQQWKAGALAGSSTKEAFFIHTGLGQTMTELDIQEGRMIIEIGMAVARPAEFIILRFMQKMLAES